MSNIDAIDDVLGHIGMYPAKVIGGENPYEERTEYMNGWNDAAMELCKKVAKTLDQLRDNEGNSNIQMLLSSGFLEHDGEGKYFLNMSDVWCWACTDGETLNELEVLEVAKFFKEYGWAGIIYWVSKKNKGLRSEFYDINRYIEFVQNEEDIKLRVPGNNKRAYYKAKYTITGKR